MKKERFERAKKISVELEHINYLIVCFERYKKYDENIINLELHIETDCTPFKTYSDFGDFINKKFITSLLEEKKKRKAELEKEFEDL